MSRSSRTTPLHPFALGAVALALSLIGCASMGAHDVQPLDAASATAATGTTFPAQRWEDVFAHPAALRITAFNTGAVYTGTKILIEGDNPLTPEALKHDQWVPALAYLVEHETEGRILFDTGVPSADAKGACDFGRWPLFSVPCRAAGDQNIRAQLEARHVRPSDLRFVAVSHFHGDHAGGLHDLERDAAVPVLTTGEEWRAVNHTFPAFEGYLTELIAGTYPIRTVPSQRAVVMPLVGRVVDLFGDGAIWLIPATGHSRGQFSALLNARGGPVLLTFDAAHLAASLELRIPPGFVVDRNAALDTIDRLRALREAFPSMRVFFGHEPSQWVGKPRASTIVDHTSLY
ncbi:MAG: N-acyl homoserine lactone hydrolase [Myxococcaceae bacterium]|nr:N-acyl homoserine lactone hydrolase [Myxococcaceae bacterium]